MRDARIDSLRVIAILSVLMTHATNAPYFSHPTQAPLGWTVVYTLIAAFNFQLFVFLSGWVAKVRARRRHRTHPAAARVALDGGALPRLRVRSARHASRPRRVARRHSSAGVAFSTSASRSSASRRRDAGT